MNVVLDEISHFHASVQGMEVNPTKVSRTSNEIFLKYNLPCNNAIHVSGIFLVSTFKLLGLIFSDDLFCNFHVDYPGRLELGLV